MKLLKVYISTAWKALKMGHEVYTIKCYQITELTTEREKYHVLNQSAKCLFNIVHSEDIKLESLLEKQ